MWLKINYITVQQQQKCSQKKGETHAQNRCAERETVKVGDMEEKRNLEHIKNLPAYDINGFSEFLSSPFWPSPFSTFS